MSKYRVCLIGAGFISEVHAEAINKIASTELSAIVDINESAAKNLASKFSAQHVFTSIEAMIEANVADVCHVLLPPPLHEPVVKQLLNAGMQVLVEKPVTIDSSEAYALAELAKDKDRILGVNHNAIWFPVFKQLRDKLASGKYGQLKHVDCVFMAPLRQLQARQFSHWMFAEPGNILLEQAVHPLSQIQALVGEIKEFKALRGDTVTLPNGQPFYPKMSATLFADKAQAQFHFEVGVEYQVWRVRAVCEDGVIEADLVNGQLSESGKTRYLDAMDFWLDGVKKSARALWQGTRDISNYAMALSGLKERSDSFYQGIRHSVADFYEQLSRNTAPMTDANFGGHLVKLCEDISSEVFDVKADIKEREIKTDDNFDVLLLGGTGFIGRHTMTQLLAAGYSVGVMARNMNQLDDCFYQDGVSLIKGNITNSEDVEAAIARSTYVVNLAHGGASGSWEAIRNAMVGGAERIAQACLKNNIKQLIHLGSIAGLYLGDKSPAITATTLPDPQKEERGEYARAKAEADLMLLDMHRTQELPIVLMRPGVVVGEGGIPFHSGIGLFNNTQHCIGWNQGNNPLPFVLVDDVASAIVQAIKKGVTGKSYNLVGDVQLNAREYIEELGRVLGRPLHFHSQAVSSLYGVEWFKWLVKKAAGRNVPSPSMRDFKSRGMVTPFDCHAEKSDLDWQPESNRQAFIERGIHCYRPE
ncbi:NAD-dependent epimerase/dehydratase family protein [Pleionea sp. CnH1-48]|uniref:NAD-dependent epimerase/dehydratase family protein n=1 Tax=Pleionea sp. CnH1-48 TaxID=2954494 RepID=UPI002096ED17|nr:NAD-dependent epimerase/dehydratase family protein [Pleionea sp. CnH1-48]MCO7226242.1 NAD-dependent epimerase/dehydratase family protein [Pleionea sp. CnH1-48]